MGLIDMKYVQYHMVEILILLPTEEKEDRTKKKEDVGKGKGEEAQ